MYDNYRVFLIYNISVFEGIVRNYKKSFLSLNIFELSKFCRNVDENELA